MTHEEESLRRLQRERTARVKRILRWMPRRATMHRYPILKWFAKSARKRPSLWTFRTSAVIPALYAGSILSLCPVYGIQIPVAVLLAFWLRANLPVLVALQAITNPLTFLPIYYADYQIGRIIVSLFQIETPHLNIHELKAFFVAFEDGLWAQNFTYAVEIWALMMLGGCVLGTFMGGVLSLTYRIGAHEASQTFQRLHALQEKRRLAAETAAATATENGTKDAPSKNSPTSPTHPDTRASSSPPSSP
jgi:hypothetical protein